MSVIASQTFPGVSQKRFDALAKKASASGVAIAGNTGQATQSGVTIAWKYDPAAQVLELQCLKKPFIVPTSVVNSKMRDLVEATPEPQA